MKKQTKTTGFTLVEMLVVIAIIGVLAATVMTAMKSLRDHGHKTKCKANLHSLATGVINRTSENDGRTMYASSFVYQWSFIWGDRRGWVSWIDNNGKNPGYSGKNPPQNQFTQPTCYVGTGSSNGRNAIMNGEMWGFVDKNMSVYLCPSHKNTKVQAGSAKYPVCRSYAMNGYFFYSTNNQGTEGGSGDGNGRDGDGWTDGYERRLYDIPEPMRMMLFAEMKIDPKDPKYNGQGQYGDSVLDAWGNNVPKGPRNSKKNIKDLYDSPGNLETTPYESIGFNHKSQGQNYGHVAFADGHVREIPEKYTVPGTNNKVNPTLRAALGKY